MTSLSVETPSSRPVIALTGATGFIGKHILDELIKRGDTVRALTRRPQPERAGVEWVLGDLQDQQALNSLVTTAQAVIHCAGSVKAPSREAFIDANARAVSRVLDAIRKNGCKAKLVHISSMAAREPELSHYALSKAAAEAILQRTSDVEWTAVRPPAVYGPGDLEILKMIKTLKFGVAFLPGMAPTRVSFIHAEDLTRAILSLIESSETKNKIYELDDGEIDGHTIASVYKTAANLMNKRVYFIPVPKFILTLVALVNQGISCLIGRTPMLTPGKVRELTHRDWTAKSPKLNASGIWGPEIPLKSGLNDTLAWYRHNHLL